MPRVIAYAAIGAIGIAVGGFIIFQTPDSDPVAMQTKYRTEFSGFVKTDTGLDIHYSDQGCRGCSVLVLLHGNNASLHTFQPLAKALEVHYRIIAFDQPGHGLTGPHPQDDYSAQAYHSVLNTVVDHFQVGEFALGGSSMGGWIAWRYALANPSKLSALILMGSSGAPRSANSDEPRPYLGARIIRSPIGRWIGQRITPRELVRRSLFETVGDQSFVTETLVDRYWELLRYPGNRRAAAVRAVTDRELRYSHQLNRISVPTLILWGDKDQVTPLADARTFDDRIPNSMLVVFPNIGHALMEEAPERTADAIAAFLDGRKRR